MRARANGIELEYETIGDPRHPALVLIAGFAQQLVSWEDDFCALLAGRGFYVVRFDNRDVGLSTKMEGAPVPNIHAILTGDTSSRAYSIEDMASDTIGLLQALGFHTAHVVGTSMGGMIAQTVAIREFPRVMSLTSIMSTTGDRSVGQSLPEALAFVSSRPPPEREAFIEHGLRVRVGLQGPGFSFDEARARARAAKAYDRAYYPAGAGRQLAALVSQRDRTRELNGLRVPTLVIHGTSDPLIDISGGEATARAIPGATFLRVPGMGHDLPEGSWQVIVDAIVDNTKRT